MNSSNSLVSTFSDQRDMGASSDLLAVGFLFITWLFPVHLGVWVAESGSLIIVVEYLLVLASLVSAHTLLNPKFTTIGRLLTGAVVSLLFGYLIFQFTIAIGSVWPIALFGFMLWGKCRLAVDSRYLEDRAVNTHIVLGISGLLFLGLSSLLFFNTDIAPVLGFTDETMEQIRLKVGQSEKIIDEGSPNRTMAILSSYFLGIAWMKYQGLALVEKARRSNIRLK